MSGRHSGSEAMKDELGRCRDDGSDVGRKTLPWTSFCQLKKIETHISELRSLFGPTIRQIKLLMLREKDFFQKFFK